LNSAGFFLAMSTICENFARHPRIGVAKQVLHGAQVSGMSAETIVRIRFLPYL
jgi:hypothetical protein